MDFVSKLQKIKNLPMDQWDSNIGPHVRERGESVEGLVEREGEGIREDVGGGVRGGESN